MWERFGSLILCAAFLFAALKVHKSRGRHAKATKPAGIVLAFLAGLMFLVTVTGAWVAAFARNTGVAGAVILIVVVVILGADWLHDRRPDRAAFWAAFALGLALVVGIPQFPRVFDQIGRGGHEVTGQISQTGK
jgi:drug/metabolite transporter (DMT)-like permease